MKIRPVGAELFHADRETDVRTDRHDEANNRTGILKKKHYLTVSGEFTLEEAVDMPLYK